MQAGVGAKGLTCRPSGHLSRRGPGALLSRAVARALDEDSVMHGYRRRNQLILSYDIDTQIEVVSADL
jgi:hypothetical protein